MEDRPPILPCTSFYLFWFFWYSSCSKIDSISCVYLCSSVYHVLLILGFGTLTNAFWAFKRADRKEPLDWIAVTDSVPVVDSVPWCTMTSARVLHSCWECCREDRTWCCTVRDHWRISTLCRDILLLWLWFYFIKTFSGGFIHLFTWCVVGWMYLTDRLSHRTFAIVVLEFVRKVWVFVSDRSTGIKVECQTLVSFTVGIYWWHLCSVFKGIQGITLCAANAFVAFRSGPEHSMNLFEFKYFLAVKCMHYLRWMWTYPSSSAFELTSLVRNIPSFLQIS